METVARKIAEYCIGRGIISKEQRSWLIYGIQKRCLSILGIILLLAFGCVFASPITVIAFLLAFSLLRKRTNGYHAKTVEKCLLISLILEGCYLLLVRFLFTFYLCLAVCGISVILVLTLAPYNDPKMHYTQEELYVCAKSARIRTIGLSLCAAVLWYFGVEDVAEGLVAGITMAVSLLCAAYIIHSRKKDRTHENSQRDCKSVHQNGSGENDSGRF